jgi:outer membrane protein OmpA-like peptidoglycan-associated protein
MIRLITFILATVFSARESFAQTAAVAPVDSSAIYANTKQPAISNPSVREFAPSITADGKKIFFEANVQGSKYRLYESYKQANASWGNPVDVNDINSKVDSTDLIGGPSISFDGNVLYYFRSVGFSGNHDIFYATRQKDGWSEPVSIGAPINTDGYEAFPSISADGSTLYFVRNNTVGPTSKEIRKLEGYFCTSIYRSIKNADGTWGKPERLPYPINQDCEKAPRIMADGKTLIFSSNRPGGKGDFDLYQSQLTNLGSWSIPAPLNFVNTAQSDQLPCISAEGDKMFYTYNDQDIYSVTIPHQLRQFTNNIVQGKVTDADTRQGIGVDVVITDALTSEVVSTLQSNEEDGQYTLVLPVGRSFNIEFKSAGYSSYLHAFDLRSVKKYQEIGLNVELFKTVKLALHVNDRELFEPIGAEVKIRRKGESQFFSDTSNNPKTGILNAELPIGHAYELIITSKDFKGAILDFDTKGLVIYRNFEKYIELIPEKKEVMINVADISNNSKVKSKVVLRNKDRDEVIEVSGNQMVSLRAGDRYEVEVTSDAGYAFESGSLDMTSGSTKGLEFKLQKLEADAKLTLKDINFESNSAQLTDVSYTELDRVVKLLSENPTLKVEVAAHTDDIGSDTYNTVLSKKRAQSVAEYLTQSKIQTGRFTSQGYGEKLPKVPNNTDENRAVNRRVELKIISI